MMCCAIWYFSLKPATLLKATHLHGSFHVFKIVKMVPNRAMHHICSTPVWEIFNYIDKLTKSFLRFHEIKLKNVQKEKTL